MQSYTPVWSGRIRRDHLRPLFELLSCLHAMMAEDTLMLLMLSRSG